MLKRSVLLILLFVGIVSGCRLFSPSGSGVIPQVKIVSPQDGDTIKTASVVINVEVTSNEEILKVKFFDNNLFLGEVQTYPYEHLWETAFVSNGQHNLKAEAVNVSGNTGSSPNVSVIVSKEEMYNWRFFDSPTAFNLNAIFANDSLNIWICGDNGNILSYDGSDWILSEISGTIYADLFDLHFISPNKGWCVGDNSLLRFDNGTWSQLLLLEKEKFLSIFRFDDISPGWVGNYEGRMFVFTGDSLVKYETLDTMPITDILGITPSDIWACCGNSLFHFNGTNWLLDTTFVGEKVISLCLQDGTDIWAVGTYIYFYDGYKWEKRDLPSQCGVNSELYAVHFATPSNGVACGKSDGEGLIISYDGVQWRKETIQIENRLLYGICRFTNGEGWAIGYRGTILHSKGN